MMGVSLFGDLGSEKIGPEWNENHEDFENCQFHTFFNRNLLGHIPEQIYNPFCGTDLIHRQLSAL